MQTKQIVFDKEQVLKINTKKKQQILTPRYGAKYLCIKGFVVQLIEGAVSTVAPSFMRLVQLN